MRHRAGDRDRGGPTGREHYHWDFPSRIDFISRSGIRLLNNHLVPWLSKAGRSMLCGAFRRFWGHSAGLELRRVQPNPLSQAMRTALLQDLEQFTLL
jgi:hypothetical protein